MGGGSSRGSPFPPQELVGEVSVPTFLMFLLQDDLDCRAACPLWSEVARNEAQRGAEPSGGRGAQATLSPTVPRTWVLGLSLQMAGRMEITDGPLPVEKQRDRGCSEQPKGRHQHDSPVKRGHRLGTER